MHKSGTKVQEERETAVVFPRHVSPVCTVWTEAADTNVRRAAAAILPPKPAAVKSTTIKTQNDRSAVQAASDPGELPGNEKKRSSFARFFWLSLGYFGISAGLVVMCFLGHLFIPIAVLLALFISGLVWVLIFEEDCPLSRVKDPHDRAVLLFAKIFSYTALVLMLPAAVLSLVILLAMI